MEEITKLKVDWKKIVVVIMLVILAGLVSGGATWYVSDMSKQAELDVKDEEIATLETRISQLEADLADTVEPEGELTDEEDATETETETETETDTTVEETE